MIYDKLGLDNHEIMKQTDTDVHVHGNSNAATVHTGQLNFLTSVHLLLATSFSLHTEPLSHTQDTTNHAS